MTGKLRADGFPLVPARGRKIGSRYAEDRRGGRRQRYRRACGEAERAENAVRSVPGIVVRIAGVATVAGIRGLVVPAATRGLVRAAIVIGGVRGRRSVLRRGGDRQHPAEHVGLAGEQDARNRRRYRAEQHRGKRDPGGR